MHHTLKTGLRMRNCCNLQSVHACICSICCTGLLKLLESAVQTCKLDSTQHSHEDLISLNCVFVVLGSTTHLVHFLLCLLDNSLLKTTCITGNWPAFLITLDTLEHY